MMRPLGRPPTPSMRSMASEPVESVSTFILALLPRRMIEPSPNCLVMLETARSMFFSRAGLAGFSAVAATRASDLDLSDLSALDMGDTGMMGFLAHLYRRGMTTVCQETFTRASARARTECEKPAPLSSRQPASG